jgi:hypothetical protein
MWNLVYCQEDDLELTPPPQEEPRPVAAGRRFAVAARRTLTLSPRRHASSSGGTEQQATPLQPRDHASSSVGTEQLTTPVPPRRGQKRNNIVKFTNRFNIWFTFVSAILSFKIFDANFVKKMYKLFSMQSACWSFF